MLLRILSIFVVLVISSSARAQVLISKGGNVVAKIAPQPVVGPDGTRRIVSEDGVTLSDGFPSSPSQGEMTSPGPSHFEIKYTGTDRENSGWFLFRIDNGRGKRITVDLAGGRQDQWRTLNPVISENADLDDPENFRSIPPDDESTTRLAVNGPILPSTQGELWRFVDRSERIKGGSILRFHFTPESDSTVLAMRPPFTMSYYKTWLNELETNPKVIIHNAGTSEGGWPLRVIELSRGTDEARRVDPCILITCGELGDMPDTNWAGQGIVNAFLTSGEETLPWDRNTTVLVIPVMDPDTAHKGKWLGKYLDFHGSYNPEKRLTVEGYARFFTKWCNQGFRFDAEMSLYNCESAEFSNLRCAEIGAKAERSTHEALCRSVLTAFRDHNIYHIDDEVLWDKSHPTFRISGYSQDRFGTVIVPWFINSRGRQRHLTLQQTREMGPLLVAGAANFLHSKEGEAACRQIDQKREDRIRKWLFHYPDTEIPAGKTALEVESNLRQLQSPDDWKKDLDTMNQRWKNFQKQLKKNQESLPR